MLSNLYTSFLNRLGWLDWPVVLLGYEKGWLDRKDVVEFAFSRAAKLNVVDIESSIAFSDRDSDSEFSALLLEIKATKFLFDKDSQSKSLPKRKYLRLYEIVKNESLSDDEKYSLLNELYYEFGLPDEMSGFWTYRSTDNCAIEAARNLMNSIKSGIGI